MKGREHRRRAGGGCVEATHPRRTRKAATLGARRERSSAATWRIEGLGGDEGQGNETMNTFLWVVQALLAVGLLAHGLLLLFPPKRHAR